MRGTDSRNRAMPITTPRASRRPVGSISLLLVVALACSGAAGLNDRMYASAAQAVDASRQEAGLPKPVVRQSVIRQQIVPSASHLATRVAGVGTAARSSVRPLCFWTVIGIRLPLHLTDLPPPLA